MVTKEQVINAQNEWGAGVVEIGSLKNDFSSCKSYASDFLDKLYSFEDGNVLFKPTKCEIEQFRPTKLEALSYFIAGDERACQEDKGFAIKSWCDVKWENAGVKIIDDIAVCMGNYFFIAHNQEDLKVEYTMVFKSISGSLKIILHDSHLPYQK